MKKLYLFFVLVLILMSCSSTEETIAPIFSVDILADSFVPEGGSKTIILTSNVLWSASSSDDWLTVSPSNGKKGTSITLSATENDTPDTRRGVVTLLPESGNTVKINVSQTTRYQFNVDEMELIFQPNLDTLSVSLTTKVSWEVSSNADWLTVNPEKGQGSSTLEFIASPNKTLNERQTLITLTPIVGDAIKILATQEVVQFSTNISKVSLSDNSDEKTIALTSNIPWEAISDASWLTVSPENGQSSSTLKLAVSANDTGSERMATVTLTPEVGDAIEVFVTQHGYDLYLLIGQSNMAGRGIIEPEDVTTHPRVYVLNSSNSFMIAKEPLHYDIANRGTGPGFEFGKKMADYYPSAKIGLIPAAVGGTKVTYWQIDHERNLLNQAIVKTKEAIKSGRLKGILWQQGESDSYSLDEAKAYKNLLLNIITELRKEFGDDVPIVLGGLPDFLKAKYFNTINKGLQDLASDFNSVGYSEPSKLGHIGDNLHFNSKAQRENGRNMAAKMIELHNKTK